MYCAIISTERETININTEECSPELLHQIDVKVYSYKRNKTTAIMNGVSFIVM